MSHTKFPIKLGNKDGFNGNIVYDANDNPVFQTYLSINRSVEDLRSSEKLKNEVDAMDFIVKAVNSHQQLVDALENALRRLEKADKHIDCSIEMSECEEALAKAKS